MPGKDYTADFKQQWIRLKIFVNLKDRNPAQLIADYIRSIEAVENDSSMNIRVNNAKSSGSAVAVTIQKWRQLSHRHVKTAIKRRNHPWNFPRQIPATQQVKESQEITPAISNQTPKSKIQAEPVGTETGGGNLTESSQVDSMSQLPSRPIGVHLPCYSFIHPIDVWVSYICVVVWVRWR